MKSNDFPKNPILSQATLDALNTLGGSGNNEEICEEVIKKLNLDEKITTLPHEGRPSMTELEYRLFWARTNLKKFGAIEKSGRAVWALTAKGKTLDMVKVKEMEKDLRAKEKTDADDVSEEVVEGIAELSPWKEQLLQFIVKEMSPDQFERLTKRLLRAAGFTQVEVTGQSGDGGVDGKGIYHQIDGLMSFPVIFQCKKYAGPVSASNIRDFRGAMSGRATQGLFITTGTFTRDAKKEAVRDSTLWIDLLDGEHLADKLRELKLGLKTVEQVVIDVVIDKEWYRGI